MFKKCKKCLIVKNYSSFYKSKVIKDGYENTCKDCRILARKKHVKKCESCGNTFKTARKETIFCGPKCKPQSQKRRVTVNCFICNRPKDITLSRLSGYKNFYCSDDCKNEGYSVLYSGENSIHYNTIEFNCHTCGASTKRWASQIDRSEYNYCSTGCKSEGDKKRFTGKGNPNYNPLKSDEDRITNRNFDGYPQWRRDVFERDNYTCRCCEDNGGGNLIAHHILNYGEHPNLRVEVSNGVTLCTLCHKSFHDTYGYKGNNKEQLNEFIEKYNDKKTLIPQWASFFISILNMLISSQANQKWLEGSETNAYYPNKSSWGLWSDTSALHLNS